MVGTIADRSNRRARFKAKGWPRDPAQTAAHGRSRIYRLDKQPGTPL